MGEERVSHHAEPQGCIEQRPWQGADQLRRAGQPREEIEDVERRLRLGVDQMERARVESRLVR